MKMRTNSKVTKALFLSAFCFLTFNFLLAQDNTIDSLKKVLKAAPNDTTRCNILGKMIEAESDDGAWPSYNLELKTIVEKNLSENPSGTLKLFYSKYLADALNNMGYNEQLKGNIPKALEYYQASLKKYEEFDIKKGIAYELNLIGLIYKKQKELDNALTCFLRSARLNEELGDKLQYASSINNLGIIYGAKKNYPMALKYYEMAYRLHEEVGEKKHMAINLNNIGMIYQETGDDAKELEYYNKSLKIWKELNDKWGMGFLYDMIGRHYLREKNYAKALEFGKMSFAIGKELGWPEEIRNAADLLRMIYRDTGRPKEAYDMFELYVVMRDSLLNQETRKASIKSQLKYEFDKKAAQDSVKVIEEKKVTAAQLKAEETQRYALYGGLGLVGLFAVFMVNRFRVTNNQKKIIEEQKKIVEVQKHEVEEKQKEILDSIRYAKRIQSSLLATEKYIGKNIDRLKQNN
jgi:tetratricopeptide (TPR) repeat protein